MRVPVRWGLLQRGGDDLLHLLIADEPGPARPRLVSQPLQPVLQEPAPPLRHHVPGNTQLSGNRTHRPAISARQDDPRPPGQRLRRLAPPRPRGQRHALVIGQLRGTSFGLGTAQAIKAESLTQDTSQIVREGDAFEF